MVPRIISYSTYGFDKLRVRVMVLAFNATFNNVLVISWRSVLLIDEKYSTTVKHTCRITL